MADAQLLVRAASQGQAFLYKAAALERYEPLAGDFPGSVAVGDFNGDGFVDLAVANGYCHFVSILLGNGDGTFRPRQRSRSRLELSTF